MTISNFYCWKTKKLINFSIIFCKRIFIPEIKKLITIATSVLWGIFFPVLGLEKNSSKESFSSTIYHSVSSYLALVDQSEWPQASASFLICLKDFYKNKGCPVPSLSILCKDLQAKFPNNAFIEEIHKEILSKDAEIEFFSLLVHEMEEPSEHLKNAVEALLWAVLEIAVGIVETARGDPLGGTFIAGDGIRNGREAWSEFQQAVAEKQNY